MIAAVYTSRNEGDIIECSLRHMLAEGVDMILVADNSDPGEGTRETLISLQRETGKVWWVEDRDPVHRQPALTNALTQMARLKGADWVLCCDVDEFWYASQRTIAEALADCPAHKLYAQRWLHHDWNTRRIEPERLHKVAFRPAPGVRVANGNHDCSIPGGQLGVLYLREISYRGFEHYKRKAADRIRTFDRRYEAEGGGWHMLRLEGMGEDELRAEWDAIQAIPAVYDPIPSRQPLRPR